MFILSQSLTGAALYLKLNNANQVLRPLPTLVTLTCLTMLTLLGEQIESLTQPRVTLPCNGQVCSHLSL